jgi:hypothetical protein
MKRWFDWVFSPDVRILCQAIREEKAVVYPIILLHEHLVIRYCTPKHRYLKIILARNGQVIIFYRNGKIVYNADSLLGTKYLYNLAVTYYNKLLVKAYT